MAKIQFQKKTKRILSACLCLMLVLSGIGAWASDTTAEYSLTSGDYVRLLGRGIIKGGRGYIKYHMSMAAIPGITAGM